MLSAGLHLSGLWPPFREAVRYLQAWTQYYNLTGHISSGFRTSVQQEALYRLGRTLREIAQRVSKKLGVGGVVTNAPPGTSAHNYGLAVDIEGPDQRAILDLARQIGFGTIEDDPGHINWPGWRSLISSG